MHIQNKRKRYSQVPRLSDTRYSAPQFWAVSGRFVGVKVGEANFFWGNR